MLPSTTFGRSLPARRKPEGSCDSISAPREIVIERGEIQRPRATRIPPCAPFGFDTYGHRRHGLSQIRSERHGVSIALQMRKPAAARIAFFAGLRLLLGLFIFGIGWVWAAIFSPETLRATNLWGRMTEIPCASVTDVRAGSIQGLPVLIVKSSASQSDLYIYTLGLDRDIVYSQLYTLIGPDNPLTQAFRPSGA
jgi:hypothetical protein